MSRPPVADPLADALADLPRLGAALEVPHTTPAEAETLDLILEQARRVLAREVNSEAIDRDAKIPERVIAAAGEAGLFGMVIPEEHGGLGFSLKAACRVVDELARVDRSVAVMVGLHAGLGTRGFITLGTPAAQARWLPQLATGERIAAFAATEAQAGSDLAAIRTTGRVVPEGLRLDGEKSYVTNGGFAGFYTVLARTPGLGGVRGNSLVCLPRETPGLSIGPEEHKLGIKGSSTITLTLEDAPAAMDQVLQEPGKGMEQAHGILAWGRTLMSAGCLGTAHAALAATLAHVTTRRQFKTFIGDFGSARAHVARMAALVYAMESLVRWVGEVAARNRPTLDHLSSTAKVFCSEATFEVCDTALQLHGALGFIEPVGVARMLRDCRITSIFEGANDVLLVRSGVMLASAYDGSALPALAPSLPATLREPGEAWDALAVRLGQAIAAMRSEHGVRIVQHQLVLQRLARARFCLNASAAALLRAGASTAPDALGLAGHAAGILLAEGGRHLDSLKHAVHDEERTRALTDALYAPHLESSR